MLFLDRADLGAGPDHARAFDQLLAFLNHDLGLTVLVVTHDLDTLLSIARRIVVLGRGTVLADGSAEQVMAVDDPWIKSYFSSRLTVPSATAPGAQAPAHGT